ncbi:uncharacterized protein LOC117110812 [Anneissia japonica]|uniref:uncharacterized protein LOC117110812 n=1 Tax=Anneissia japonica TaxID=1529436 RepID=UPI001425B26B|nr:uncharacterized protein LOC117110812 [Anneissia japonica]
MKIRDLVFEPGAYVRTELDGLLFLNTSYTLGITPVVIANENNKRGLTREITFITPLPKVVLPVTDNDSNAVTIALIVGGGVNLLAIIVFIILWIICTDHRGRRPYINRRKRLEKEEVNILDLDVIFPKHSQSRPTLTDYPVYEIDRSDVSWTERKELGHGYYGEVYKCRTPVNGMPTEAVIILPKRI